MHRILIGTICVLALAATSCSSDAASDDSAVTPAPAAIEPVSTEPMSTEPATTVADTEPSDTASADTQSADTQPADTADAVTDGDGSARAIVEALASDDLSGRDNLTDGSYGAQEFLYSQISEFTDPAYDGEGIDGYLQAFPAGSNVIGVIPGSDLADQYVVIGAHYDHLGSDCPSSDPSDDICNGATDNATGVAAAITAARTVAAAGPRRTVVLALWDAEEDGLLGSA